MDKSSIHLPDEIIEVILSKSAVETVVRFKSVSKSWQPIISDPQFSRTHRMQRSKQPENQNRFLIWSDYTVYLLGFEGGKLQIESELNLPYQFQKALCYCDGLFLLCTDLEQNDYALWNPSIRKHTIIRPLVPKNADFYPHLYHDDSISDDYKIVFVYENCYAVYSISCNNGSCGAMKSFPNGINWTTFQASLDGCLHKVRQPDGVKYVLELKAVSGRLCLLGVSGDIRRFQLWVMEKDGSFQKPWAWRKLMSTEYEELEVFSLELSPVCLSNEDFVVLSTLVSDEGGNHKHFIYNPRQKSFQEIQFTWEDSTEYFQYSENLYMPSSNVLV